jgi:hypothetical protein
VIGVCATDVCARACVWLMMQSWELGSPRALAHSRSHGHTQHRSSQFSRSCGCTRTLYSWPHTPAHPRRCTTQSIHRNEWQMSQTLASPSHPPTHVSPAQSRGPTVGVQTTSTDARRHAIRHQGERYHRHLAWLWETPRCWLWPAVHSHRSVLWTAPHTNQIKHTSLHGHTHKVRADYRDGCPWSMSDVRLDSSPCCLASHVRR